MCRRWDVGTRAVGWLPASLGPAGVACRDGCGGGAASRDCGGNAGIVPGRSGLPGCVGAGTSARERSDGCLPPLDPQVLRAETAAVAALPVVIAAAMRG